MQIQENISLRSYNTFHIDVKAKQFASFNSTAELEELVTEFPQAKRLILGGGSNILFTNNFDGIVLKNEIKGIQVLHEDEEYVYIKAGAGDNWHQFVLHCVNNGWGGIENLSLIPGCVGASPIQNIGAYGAEIEDVFLSLDAWHLGEKKLVTFTESDCGFGYRESVFKKKFKDQFVILNVTYKLRKQPRLNTSYGAIEQELGKMNVKEPSVKSVSEAVIRIRSSKLPDPAVIGNAGSFFKNPVVSLDKYQWLIARFPGIIAYPSSGDEMKLAAGWMIEQCGWKGKRTGDAGCHDKQALVLVNYGNAAGIDVYNLSEKIIESVKNKFDVLLEREVNVI